VTLKSRFKNVVSTAICPASYIVPRNRFFERDLQSFHGAISLALFCVRVNHAKITWRLSRFELVLVAL
jgi:hypothetical protein